jgi:hypothetical protein
VNAQVEAGAKASWDSKAGNTVGLEVASKYRLDPSSFAKVRLFPFISNKLCDCACGNCARAFKKNNAKRKI